MAEAKPYAISKQVVWEAYQKVKANHGAAGVDGQSIEAFETDLKNNLYKIWNRMSSGSYFPPPVRLVEIPKASGGLRPLGIPMTRAYCSPYQKPWGWSPRRLLGSAFVRDSFAVSSPASQHTSGRSLRRPFFPASLHRLAQSLDDLGRQPDPPRSVRRGLDAIQTTGFAPVGDGGHRHVQSLSRCLGTTAAIATLPLLTCRRSFRTAVGNPMDVAYPLDLLGCEHSSQAGLISFRVQLLGDLAIRVILGQNAEAIDDCGWGATGITRTWWPRNVHHRAGLRLPTQSHPDGRGLLGQRDVLDQQPQQLFALSGCRGQGMPQRRQVFGEVEDALPFFRAQAHRDARWRHRLLALQLL